MTASVSIAAIVWYQRTISPHKGWSCAHRVRRGGVSCSDWTKRAIARRGVWVGLRLARRRFKLCREAARESKKQDSSAKRQSCGAEHLPLECCCDSVDLGITAGDCLHGGHALACIDLSWLDFAGCACLPFI